MRTVADVVTYDLRTLQMLGWAARAVEITNGTEGQAVSDAFYFSSNDDRDGLLNLMACCLNRLWEIR